VVEVIIKKDGTCYANTHGETVYQLSRVPCVGESVFIDGKDLLVYKVVHLLHDKPYAAKLYVDQVLPHDWMA
jgi:hypothetical protein